MNRREAPAPRLVLFSPPGETDIAAALVEEACEAADVASVILRTGALNEEEILSRAGALLPVTIDAGAALLLENRAELNAMAKTDGVHLADFPAQAPLFSSLKPHFIAGAAGLASRHDAMTAGEAGADYVMFGERVNGKRPSTEAVVERVAWWAEIFEVPCVAFAASLDEIPVLVRAGSDFIALDEAAWTSGAPVETLRKAMALLQLEPAG